MATLTIEESAAIEANGHKKPTKPLQLAPKTPRQIAQEVLQLCPPGTVLEKTWADRQGIMRRNILPHRRRALLLNGCGLIHEQDLAEETKNMLRVGHPAGSIVSCGRYVFAQQECDGHFPNGPVVPAHLKAECLALTGAAMLRRTPSLRQLLAVFSGTASFEELWAVCPGQEVTTYAWLKELTLDHNDKIGGVARGVMIVGGRVAMDLVFGFKVLTQEEYGKLLGASGTLYKRWERAQRKATSSEQ